MGRLHGDGHGDSEYGSVPGDRPAGRRGPVQRPEIGQTQNPQVQDHNPPTSLVSSRGHTGASLAIVRILSPVRVLDGDGFTEGVIEVGDGSDHPLPFVPGPLVRQFVRGLLVGVVGRARRLKPPVVVRVASGSGPAGPPAVRNE